MILNIFWLFITGDKILLVLELIVYEAKSKVNNTGPHTSDFLDFICFLGLHCCFDLDIAIQAVWKHQQ